MAGRLGAIALALTAYLWAAAPASAQAPLTVGLDGTFAPHAMPKLGGGVEGFSSTAWFVDMGGARRTPQTPLVRVAIERTLDRVGGQPFRSAAASASRATRSAARGS